MIYTYTQLFCERPSWTRFCVEHCGRRLHMSFPPRAAVKHWGPAGNASGSQKSSSTHPFFPGLGWFPRVPDRRAAGHFRSRLADDTLPGGPRTQGWDGRRGVGGPAPQEWAGPSANKHQLRNIAYKTQQYKQTRVDRTVWLAESGEALVLRALDRYGELARTVNMYLSLSLSLYIYIYICIHR